MKPLSNNVENQSIFWNEKERAVKRPREMDRQIWGCVGAPLLNVDETEQDGFVRSCTPAATIWKSFSVNRRCVVKVAETFDETWHVVMQIQGVILLF